ncbi:MAG: hypothetical protein H0V56_02840 [Chthoniobacterales bacterium]|nr:hypothetical protein [Chthoniobacterales bacterium]
MPPLPASQAFVAEGVLLDGRLALFHQEQSWLAVADVHFGYELRQRAAGRLMPMWGMETIEQRLLQLMSEFCPRHLVIVGDLIHDRAAAAEAGQLIQRLAQHTTPIVLADNHDRELGRSVVAAGFVASGGLLFSPRPLRGGNPRLGADSRPPPSRGYHP